MTAETTTPLTAAEKRLVLTEIREQLQYDAADLLERIGTDLPSRNAELERVLEPLVSIVKRSSATRIEPYLSQIHDDICAHCPHQEHSAHCALRYEHQCLVYTGAGPIVAAIRRALRELEIERELIKARP